ncbi:hypothetical protein AJ79_04669 [Helicocarpus griseus UAMH5409]|uniref:UBA domain-containing protein n=1 Tax=Helicocarpus griseus UAMH5409 TaxID=1447875 RepID=A0A2B7XT54_9EURO|nr:hypothetical protein AJ79_04669 [Helicocarpus griseus UAMH5409]
MSFSFHPASHLAPLPEVKTKERKPRYTMPALQVRWPMRASTRSIDGSPTRTKSKYVFKKAKSKSVSLPQSKSTDMVAVDAQVNPKEKGNLDPNAPTLPPHSPLDASLGWIQKEDSPVYPDAHALESVQSPEEITPRTPSADKKEKLLNSKPDELESIKMSSVEGCASTPARQRQNPESSRSQEAGISPPPMHPARNRPYCKLSDIETPHNISGEPTSGAVSPILSLFHQQTSPTSFEDKRSIAGLSIVSPLSTDVPQPLIAPSFERVLKPETAPSLARTRKSGDSSTSSEFDRNVSVPSSPPSSRSSIYSNDIPPKSAATDTDVVSIKSKAYSIISPVSAGVFDDDPGLKRNPTFKKKLSIKQSRDKPLPPEPAIKIPPLSIRRTSAPAPMGRTPYGGRLILPASQPRFLPSEPRPSDLDILDEAFRRSGLRHGLSPNRCAKSKYRRMSESSTRSSSPSLRTATIDLEEQLSSLSAITSENTSWLKIGRARCASSRFPMDSPPKPLKPRPSRRKSDSHSIVPSTKGFQPAKIKPHASFKLSKKRSWSGKDTMRLTLTINEPADEDNKSQWQPSPLYLNYNGHDNGNSNNGTKLPDKGNRTSMFTKGRTGSAERSLRLRLPRLRTQLSAKSISGPVHLSAVVESPTDREHISNNIASPQHRIMAALDRLDSNPTRPESSHNHTYDDTPVEEPLSIFELDGSPSPKHAGSKDMLCEEIPSGVAKAIIYQIMQEVDNLEDLFNLAVINKAFYCVFRENSLTLIKDTLYRMSPSAWELREISPPWETENDEAGDIDMPVPEYTPNIYIRHYTRDLYTMVALKSLILVRCENFLRPDTARALAGLDEVRCAKVDEAFWRVWTFCKLFGCGKGREDDITAQVDWLNGGQIADAESRGASMVVQYPLGVNSVLFNAPPGFSKGNHGGLSPTELYDMMEIWTCLGVLLQVFHGKRKEAREFGIFDGLDVELDDVAKEESLIENWTQYILTLGPSAILALTSINPDVPVETLFTRAQSNGWTKWTSPNETSGASPRLFLKEAVSQVYESRIACIQTPPSSGTPKSKSPSPRARSSSPRSQISHSRESSSSSAYSLSSQASNLNRQRQAGFAAELRRKRKESQSLDMSISLDAPPAAVHFTDERPISSFSTVIERLEGGTGSEQTPVPTMSTTNPPPVDTTIRSLQRTDSSIQNTPTVYSPQPMKETLSTSPPPLPTLVLESPTPPPDPVILSSSSPSSSSSLTPSAIQQASLFSPSNVQKPTFPSSSNLEQPEQTPPRSKPVLEEKISRGRYPSSHAQVLDPVDMAMHKMVAELGFSEEDAKWALKCTDTGESLDVAAAINLLLKGDGHVDPVAVSATIAPDTGYMYSGAASGSGRVGAGAEGVCRSKTLGYEKYDDVWRPVWRWA